MEPIKDKDYLLDAVNFSDSDPDSKIPELNSQFYNKEMNKLDTLYNQNMDEDDFTMNSYQGTKHEIINDKDNKNIPVPVQLLSDDKLISIGKIESIVEGKIIIPITNNDKILNLDNIIYDYTRSPIGFIDDIIGQIYKAYYIIRLFPGITNNNLTDNNELFFCENKCKYVNLCEIKKSKGCDASNEFDEEVNENEMEFSDDEEEIMAKANRRNNKKQKVDNDSTNVLNNANNVDINKNNCNNNNSNNNCNNLFVNPEYSFKNLNTNPNDLFSNMINNAINMNLNPFANPNK